MDKTISGGLRNLFLLHAIVGLVLGLPLWIVPGRFLQLVGWIPAMVQLPQSKLSVPGQTFVDEIITRLLGAVVVALAVSSFQCYRAKNWEQVEFVVQLEAVFCVLGSITVIVTGLFLMDRPMTPFGWAVAAILTIFAIGWVLAMRARPAPGPS